MATEAVQQVLDTSVDPVGLSVASSMMTADDPRHGSMYNPVVLAAGVPVWFHPLQDNQYVAVFQSHWFNATVGTGGPQSYTDLTEAGSCWVRVAPPTGGITSLGPIPTALPGTLVINGAASRVDYLFTVGNLDGAALIQHHRVTLRNSLVVQGEELMFPGGNGGVLFDKGCYLDGTFLVVLGTDADGNVYQCRRNWGRIGVPDTTLGWTWQYRGEKGWLPDPNSLSPVGLTTMPSCPVSAAMFKDWLLLSTVAQDYTVKVFRARATDPFGKWKPDTAGAVSLGDATTYLGGTMYFQPQLGRNPAVPMPAGAVAAIPYVSSTKVISGPEQAINTAWGLWPVTSTV